MEKLPESDTKSTEEEEIMSEQTNELEAKLIEVLKEYFAEHNIPYVFIYWKSKRQKYPPFIPDLINEHGILIIKERLNWTEKTKSVLASREFVREVAKRLGFNRIKQLNWLLPGAIRETNAKMPNKQRFFKISNTLVALVEQQLKENGYEEIRKFEKKYELPAGEFYVYFLSFAKIRRE